MSIFNVPCPSCGSTRALAALADFNVASALRYNPLFVIGLGAMLLFPLLQRFRWSRRENALWLMFAAAVSLNWAYLFLFLPR